MMRSLQARLLAGIIGGMALLLTIFSLLLYAMIARALVSQFDASLASIAQILATSVERDEDQIEMDLAVQQMPQLQNPGQPTYYELRRPDGTVVAKSPLLGARDLPRLDAAGKTRAFTALQDSDGSPLRAVGLTFVPRDADREGEQATAQPTSGESLTLAVARDVTDLQRQLRSLRWLLMAASGLVTGLSVLIGALIVGRGLRPLRLIAAEIAAVDVDHLAARIEAEHAPAEVVPIRDRLNDLLHRLEASFSRERQFNADVAHELRTPLAGIRSTIEVALTRTRDSAEYRAALSDCLEITTGMQSIIGNLLMLARLDARQITFRTEEIQLAEAVNNCWRTLADRAYERQIVFQNDIGETTCQLDREHLSMVVTNLLDNAIEYANERGHIRAAARQSRDYVEITISNTGCQMTPEQVPHVFEVFWRGDSARVGTGTHCGLGMALVQRLVRALGGRVTAELQQGGIFAVQLTFPTPP
jgi:two-component system heavy metal sensor histidine kinase CusS